MLRLASMTFAGVMVALFVIYPVKNADPVTRRATELVEMVEPIQDTIEAVYIQDAADMKLLDSGEAGLPEEVFVSEEVHGIFH